MSIKVIITNEDVTSAVAIFYDEEKNTAPVVVTKGKDEKALKIHSIAKSHKISIIKNPTLTYSLYENIAINTEISDNFYTEVAEVFTYIFKNGCDAQDAPNDAFDGLNS